MISWQTAAHWPYVEAPFPFYLVFYDRGRDRGLGIGYPEDKGGSAPCPAAHKVDLGRRGRPNAQASVGFVPGAKARSAHQSRGLASLVRVTWCFDCSPHGSAGSTGCAEAVVGITCPKPAGRRCWVATAGDCTLDTVIGNGKCPLVYDRMHTLVMIAGKLGICVR